MRLYRCYFLNQYSNIESVKIIEAQTDAEAVGRADALFAGKSAALGAVEVWEEARRVHYARRGASARPVAREINAPREIKETPEQIRHWRMKAEEIRTAVEDMRDRSARQAFLNAAATYETLADRAEARLQRKIEKQTETG
jgi:hypothetical protein